MDTEKVTKYSVYARDTKTKCETLIDARDIVSKIYKLGEYLVRTKDEKTYYVSADVLNYIEDRLGLK